MFSDSAPCQCIGRRISWAVVWRGYGVLHIVYQESDGDGQSAGISGKYGGSILGGYLYQRFGRLTLAYFGEVFGTGILGGMLCYPVATLVMGKEAAIFAYVIPFLMSTMCGTVIAAFLIGVLYKSGAFQYMRRMLDLDVQTGKAMGR